MFQVEPDVRLPIVQTGIRAGLRSPVLAWHRSHVTGLAVLLLTLSEGDKAPPPPLVPPEAAPAVQGPSASLQGSPSSSGAAVLVNAGLAPPPPGFLIPGPGRLCPRLCCCSPHLSPGPHPYWLGYVHSVCRRAGRGAYTHGLQVIYTLCIYIYVYIYTAYIYLFTFIHIYILYRTFTFYQKQFCDFTHGLSPEILTPGQKQDWNEGLIHTGMGTENGTLPLGHAAGPLPGVSTPLGNCSRCVYSGDLSTRWGSFPASVYGAGPVPRC